MRLKFGVRDQLQDTHYFKYLRNTLRDGFGGLGRILGVLTTVPPGTADLRDHSKKRSHFGARGVVR